MYSLESTRESYMIIYGCQQLKGLNKNILRLNAKWKRDMDNNSKIPKMQMVNNYQE